MKIVILSTSNPNRVAGVVAKDIMDGFKVIPEVEVKLVVKQWDKYRDKNIVSVDNRFVHYRDLLIKKWINLQKRIGIRKKQKKLNILDEKYSILDYDQTIIWYSTKKLLKKIGKPDVIIVLFMQKFLSYKNLYELNIHTMAPIYLRMQDIAPITGGCHLAWDCLGYQRECGKCPALHSDDPADQSHINWCYKKAFVEQTDIKVFTGSSWLYDKIQKGSMFRNKEKYKIPIPIDESLYHPGRKNEARSALNLPMNKKIIFFGANAFFKKNKGFKELVESLYVLRGKLNQNDTQNIHLAIAGNYSKKIDFILPFEYTSLGLLSHEQLPLAFQAADFFVSPSIEDPGPMMVNQSLMCGTPVVAFEMGVAVDLVISGETGYKAKLLDIEDMANGMAYMLQLKEDEYLKLCSASRDIAIRTNSIHVVINEIFSIIKGSK